MNESVIADDKQDKILSRFVLHDILDTRITTPNGIYRIFDRVDALPEVDLDNSTTPWDEVILEGYNAIGRGEIIDREQLVRSGFEEGFRSTPHECTIASGSIVVVRLDRQGVSCINGGITEKFYVIMAACLTAFPRLIPASPHSLCRALPHLIGTNRGLAEMFGGSRTEITVCSPVLFCPHRDTFKCMMGVRVGRLVHPPELVHLYALFNTGDIRLLFRAEDIDH